MPIKKSTPQNTIIQLQKVSRTYGEGENAVEALRNVTVGFSGGSFTAIMGPSGSGKSTLLQCAAGLDRPTEGRVTLAGTELTTLSEKQLTLLRREHIGFVFQSFNLLSSLTAEQNVGLPMRLAGHTPDSLAVTQALEQVGLGDRLHHRPDELSGGQQQRVAIARALVMRPDILFADEPTGALDIASGRSLLQLLQKLVVDHGQTIIMVTHDPNAASYADRALFLVDGALIGEIINPTAKQVAQQMAGLETA